MPSHKLVSDTAIILKKTKHVGTKVATTLIMNE